MSSTLLIKNAWILTSASAEPIENGALLVKDGRIAKIGHFVARADVTIDAEGALLMPGFIQGHIHLCQTLFRGLGEDMPLLPWLRNIIWPLEAVHDEESIYLSALLTCAELIKNGTTAFLSIETVRHTRHVARAVHDAGLAGVIGHCLMDETGGYAPLAVDIDDSLADLDVLREEWDGHPRIRIAVAPRFALSCSSRNMRLAADYAREYGLRLHTHSSEQVEEVEWVRARTGMPNIEYLHAVGLTGPDVGLAHCVHTEPHEREILRDTGTSVLHCPSANLKLASGIAPIPEYLEMGINVSIGADGAPCNNRLDPFLEMREAGLLQKIRRGAKALHAREVVRMATEGGARALGWFDEMGSLDVGKRANMILVDQSDVSVLPSLDPFTNLVYSNSASHVRMTMVDGKILYDDGELTTIDEEKLRDAVRRARARLCKKAGM